MSVTFGMMTLAPHTFMWFRLATSREDEATVTYDYAVPEVSITGQWQSALRDKPAKSLQRAISAICVASDGSVERRGNSSTFVSLKSCRCERTLWTLACCSWKCHTTRAHRTTTTCRSDSPKVSVALMWKHNTHKR